MSTLAILPIKSLDAAKQRLADELDLPTRRALVEAMFCDALVALRRVHGLDGILVVSRDHNAQRIAGGYGAMVIEDDDRGHNHAASRGIARARELAADRALLVPGDCPLLSAAEIDELLDRPAPVLSALIVPDRHGTGTNALLLTPPDALPPSFGVGSHERHRREAATAGVAAETVELGSLGLDVDTPEDLATVRDRLAHTHGGAAHTRGMLLQLARSRG